MKLDNFSDLIKNGTLGIFMHLIEKLKRRVVDIYNRYFDYYYLKAEMQHASNADYLWGGSSYACFGLTKDTDYKEALIGLPSQDFYYSDKIIKKAINSKTKMVIVIFGYYSLFSDLSRATEISEVARVDCVYYPLFQDSHNRKIGARSKSLRAHVLFILDSVIWVILRFTVFISIPADYFDRWMHSRELRKQTEWKDFKKKYSDLTSKERMVAAKRRVFQHEKLFRWTETSNENKAILSQLHKYLKMKNIPLAFIIPPFSSEYLSSMDAVYKENTRKSIDFFQSNSDFFFDFNNLPQIQISWDKEDFVDPDHLSDKGADKFTKILRELLYR